MVGRSWWRLVTVLATVLAVLSMWLPGSAWSDVPEWGDEAEWNEESERGDEAEEGGSSETGEEWSRQRVSTPVMVGIQTAAWAMGSVAYWGTGVLLMYPLSLMGDAVLFWGTAALAIGYPFTSAWLVNFAGRGLGGGSYYGWTLLGSVLGYGASIALIVGTESVGPMVAAVGSILGITSGVVGPMLGYHLARRSERRSHEVQVGVSPVMSAPTAWGMRSLDGAGMQLRVSF